MKYLISVSIDSDKNLNPQNLQEVKVLVEETVIENLRLPKGVNIFVNTRVIKED